MDSGGPPLVSLEDFDTAPPSNINDDQLMTDDTASKSEDELTQMSIAVSLRKTFPVRLAITKFLNDIGSKGSYEETLRLDTELREAYKTLYQTLQAYRTSTARSLSRFETCVVDMILCRYLSSLHIPFLGSSLHEAAYAFSRKVVIETALKMWATMNLSSFIITTPSCTNTPSLNPDDIIRLIICSSGSFRTIAFQASFVIAAELRTQLQENNPLGSAPLRLDLLSVLDDAKALMLRCIEAGETNIKNYLLICEVSAQINGLMRGLPQDEFPQLLIEAAKDAVTRCLSILERNAAQCREEVALDGEGFSQMSLNMQDDAMEGWEFLVYS